MTLSTTARNTIIDALCALLNSGNLFFRTSGGTEVAKCTFGATAFGAGSTGVATAAAITSDTNADGGTIANMQLRKSDNTVIATLSTTVAGGGGEVILSSLAVTSGETLAIDSCVLTCPAS